MKTKHVVVTLMLIMTGLLCCSCGTQKEGSSDQLEGSLGDIIAGLYTVR